MSDFVDPTAGQPTAAPSPAAQPAAAPVAAAPVSGVPDGEPDPVAPVAPTAAPPSVEAVAEQDDELVVLDALEADLAAVEQAISTLEQVAADGIGGEQAAAQIAAAVSAERFGTASSGA